MATVINADSAPVATVPIAVPSVVMGVGILYWYLAAPLPVHLYGQLADMTQITELANEERRELDTHLTECATCRAETEPKTTQLLLSLTDASGA